MPERILEAAVDVLRESGLQRLTQTEVSARAGIRQSHLTYYFPHREDLIEAVGDRIVHMITSGIRGAVKEPKAGIIQELATSVADLAHMRIFVAMIVEADSDPELRALMVGATAEMESVLSEALGESEERSRTLLAAIWGLGLYRLLVRPAAEHDPTRALIGRLTDT